MDAFEKQIQEAITDELACQILGKMNPLEKCKLRALLAFKRLGIRGNMLVQVMSQIGSNN
ncbi:MAG TPA: hypothetical protein ENH94_08495 [Phycisphaerales bacterium]|nr:hypothetical protein [Phycisphaerales bacterium]